MDSGKAQTLVVTTMAASGVLLFVRAAAENRKPTPRAGLGVLLAGVGLSATAQLAPQLAGGLALLWLTGEVFMYGGPAFKSLTGAVSPTAARLSSSARYVSA